MPAGKPTRSRARTAVTWTVPLLLFLPASTLIPAARWNVHLIGRLRELNRPSPDAGLDGYYRSLNPFLPRGGPVGFNMAGASDDGRTFFRMQYALVPLQLLRSPDAEFVVEVGPVDADNSLAKDRRFALVTTRGDDLRLYRKVQP